MTNQIDFSNTEEALADFFALLPSEIKRGDNLGERVSIKGAFAAVFEWLTGEASGFFSALVFLFALGLLFFLAEGFLTKEKADDTAKHALSVVFGVALMGVISPLVTGLEEGLREVFTFFSSALPFLYAAELSSGGTVSAASLYVGNQSLLWLFEWVLSLFLPLCVLLLSLSLVSFLCPAAGRFARSLKKAVCVFLGFIGTLFSAVMSLKTFLGSTKDTFALRTAKYTLQQAVPVVGSSVSSAVETLAASMSYLKNTVGAVGIYTIAILILPVFLRLLLLRFFLSFFGGMFAGDDSGVLTLFSSFADALDTVIAVAVFSSVLFIFSFVLFMMSGVAALR